MSVKINNNTSARETPQTDSVRPLDLIAIKKRSLARFHESIYHRMAYWASVIPFTHIALAILYNTVVHSNDQDGSVAYAFRIMSTILQVSGISLGATALTGIQKYGSKGIAIRSVAGILFGTLVLILNWRFS